ncbi:hypothetical protein DPM19_09270 [Actinomadura craniellae]|uniref:Band 7 domain-containing protein n=2 Tax=Actinomadura craniellae TaxID=2231787 RepID=A0A365HA20_9ACTN|nr:hypothetical protein DPM19_09270 [Actinomadura craniellae]
MALVLVPYEGNPTTIRHGEPVPEARYGTYQYSFLVDVTEHRLVLDIPLLSKDPGFAFRSRVTLSCQVGDPAAVVTRMIRDVGAALQEPIKHMLRMVSRRFDIPELHAAEQALNAEVRDFPGDSALRLRNIYVELVVDDEEILTSGRRFRDIEREFRLESRRRVHHLEMMRAEGAEGLLAMIVAREGPRAALEWIAKAEATERDELLRTLQALLRDGDGDREPFDLVDAQDQVVQRLLGGSTVAFGGTRPSRLRGSLVPGESGRGKAVEAAGPGADGSRRRPPGSAGETSGAPDVNIPPDDEPAGGAADTVEDRSYPRPASRVRGVRRPVEDW